MGGTMGARIDARLSEPARPGPMPGARTRSSRLPLDGWRLTHLPTSRAWWRHLLRAQTLGAALGLALFLAVSPRAYTDAPLLLRRQMELYGARVRVAQGGAALIRVPVLSQMPDYYNGCELTSLDMLLRFAGDRIPLSTLAARLPRTHAPLVTTSDGSIESWGNPNVGFVGSVRGVGPGYGVYHGPIARLLDDFLPGRALDLTGSPWRTLRLVVASGRPVIVWTTIDFAPVSNWVTWTSPQGPVRATMSEHAVLLVGMNRHFAYVNNPLNGERAEAVPLSSFLASWIDLGRQAVTLSPAGKG